MVRRRSSTVQKPMLPGEAVMLGTLAKRRSTLRLPTRRIAWLTFQTLPKHERVALVKDISERGIYFYSDFDPDIGDQLEFVVEYLSGSEKVRLHLKGKVVRVEKAGAGSACGVAISFYSHLDWTSPTPVQCASGKKLAPHAKAATRRVWELRRAARADGGSFAQFFIRDLQL